MEIEYAKRSGFTDPCATAIRDQLTELRAGRTIEISLGLGGYDATVTVFISQRNQEAFDSNWSSSDPSRFPVRIRAAATALLSCGLAGSFQISHRNGALSIQPVLATHGAVLDRQVGLAVKSIEKVPPARLQIANASLDARSSPNPRGAAEVVLVSCVSAKRPTPSLAKELYTSPWFVKARRHAEASGRPWFILSAEHGLVDPDQVVAPYEKTLNTMGVDQRRAWAARVAAQLDAAIPDLSGAVFLAGERYREFLIPHLIAKVVSVDVPMAGLRIGEQLSWLDAQARAG